MEDKICKICNKEFKSNAGLGHHIKSRHGLSTQAYFDMHNDDSLKYCKICGKDNKFINLIIGYTIGCCTEHTNMIRYNVKNPFQAKECKEKAKQTKLDRYGNENYNNRAECAQTIQQKFGKEFSNISQVPCIKNKIKKTNIKNLGVEMPFMSHIIQLKANDTKERRYGNRYYTNRDKFYETMKKNRFISKYEVAFEQILLLSHIEFIPQYKDKRYPFYCDFYIPSKDLFIEINAYPAHGLHPFDKNNAEDIKELNKLNQLAKSKPVYLDWIKRWTEVDVKKRQIALDNNLNYYELYNDYEINDFIFSILQIPNIDFMSIYKSL